MTSEYSPSPKPDPGSDEFQRALGDYLTRIERDGTVALDEFQRHHPEFADRLGKQLDWLNAHLGRGKEGLPEHIGPYRVIQRLGTGGPPLGILPAANFRQSEMELEPGDLLVIYTDGLSEAVNPEDEEFGIERLESVTRDCRERPLGALREAIEEALDDFAAGVPFADDRTLLLVRRSP